MEEEQWNIINPTFNPPTPRDPPLSGLFLKCFQPASQPPNSSHCSQDVSKFYYVHFCLLNFIMLFQIFYPAQICSLKKTHPGPLATWPWPCGLDHNGITWPGPDVNKTLWKCFLAILTTSTPHIHNPKKDLKSWDPYLFSSQIILPIFKRERAENCDDALLGNFSIFVLCHWHLFCPFSQLLLHIFTIRKKIWKTEIYSFHSTNYLNKIWMGRGRKRRRRSLFGSAMVFFCIIWYAAAVFITSQQLLSLETQFKQQNDPLAI